jgi:hypothetical protein
MPDRDFRLMLDSLAEAIDSARKSRDSEERETAETRLRIAISAQKRREYV